MGTIKESEFPGIGKKFQMDTESGDKIVVVIHDDGQRELYHYDHSDSDESISQVTLDDAEARQFAAILGGMTYQPKALETLQVALEDLVIERCKVDPSYKGVDKTIEELGVRQRTGAMILALIEGKGKQKINPGPDDRLVAGMTLVIAGEKQQIKQFKELLVNG